MAELDAVDLRAAIAHLGAMNDRLDNLDHGNLLDHNMLRDVMDQQRQLSANLEAQLAELAPAEEQQQEVGEENLNVGETLAEMCSHIMCI